MSAAFGIVTCPDCTRAVHGQHLVHEQTCPLGRGYDQIQNDDREWFERHPGGDTRVRPVHWAEVADLRMYGALPAVGEIVGDIIVTQIQPGFRTKSFAELVCILIPGGGPR